MTKLLQEHASNQFLEINICPDGMKIIKSDTGIFLCFNLKLDSKRSI